MMVLSFTPVEATWTDIHQISSSSHTIQITGDGYNMPPENAYDGIGSQAGDPVLLRTDPCYTQSTPSQGSSIEIDYTLSTNQSSVPFNIEFRLTHVANNAPDSYVSVSLYNTATQNYDQIAQITDSSGTDYNISRSSAYMDNAGNIYLNVFTGHGNQDCNSYAEVRFYEFFIYTDIVEEPNFDQDNDGIEDSMDSCPSGEINWISNPSTDHDGDGCKDDSTEDLDDDNDGISDDNDTCNVGDLFTSNPVSDYDGDGCKDDSEDNDDDNDGINDGLDQCGKGQMGWLSSTSNDYDQDGCFDSSNEDSDDDNDGIVDLDDGCNTGLLEWTSSQSNDYDSDGCHDGTEDDDDDGDTVNDGIDQCKTGVLNWISNGDTDYDGDGCEDDNPEDPDDDNDGVADNVDTCETGVLNWISNGDTDHDGDGCKDDNPEDPDDDNDGVADNMDTCETGNIAFTGADRDGDGCQDSDEDDDDDNDNVKDPQDNCDNDTSEMNWFSDFVTDYDGDGCKDDGSEDLDEDNDGVANNADRCRTGSLNWGSNAVTDYDGDGCWDEIEDGDFDNDNKQNNLDECEKGILNWISDSNSDHDGDGCKDDSTEDLDDDNDNVTDANDDCPKSPLGITVGDDGCAVDSQKEVATKSNDFPVQEVVVSGIGVSLIGAVLWAFFTGFFTRGLVGGIEIEPTSAELIEYIEQLENNIVDSDARLLAESNTYFSEVLRNTYELIDKYKGDPKVSLISVTDVYTKMLKYGRCEISGVVLLRALSTTLLRFHRKRQIHNGHPWNVHKDKLHNEVKPSGKKIIDEFVALIRSKEKKNGKKELRKWFESTPNKDIFIKLQTTLSNFSSVIHPEDKTTIIEKYQQEDFAKDCTLITDYLKILINHPPYPYPSRDLSVEVQTEPVYYQQS